MKRNDSIFIICLISGLLIHSLAFGSENLVSRYNVIWNTPSKDATGVMPLGNGDIAAGVYAIENGDLFLLLAKNDAYTYMGDIFKTGRIRISLKPNPFVAGKPFRQTLDLATGSIHIEADGLKLRIWADANRPVFHVEINSIKEIAVTAQPDLWIRFDHTSFNVTKFYTSAGGWLPDAEPTQDVKLEKNGKMIWYYSVGDRSILADDLKFYNVGQMAKKVTDPFRYNTFGNLLESPDLKLSGGIFSGEGKSFDIRIHALTMKTPTSSKWVEAIESQAAQPISLKKDWENNCRWWADFWNRSWIIAADNTLPKADREKLNGEPSASGSRDEKDGAALTAQSYNVFRFLMACQSRGTVQVKFNGGLFTQQLKLKGNDKRNRSGNLQPVNDYWITSEDDRLWGRRFTFQNQRLLYGRSLPVEIMT